MYAIFRTASAALLCLALFAPVVSASAPTVVMVPAGAAWVDTGISVTSGDTLSLRSTGAARTAPEPDFEGLSVSGPAGQTWQPTCGENDFEGSGGCANSDAFFGELVGRIGDGDSFIIGDADSLVVTETGTLYLAVNDFMNYYWDNYGGFTVLIR